MAAVTDHRAPAAIPGARSDHASLAVADLEAAIAFYRAAFGYEVLFRDAHDDAIATLIGIPGLRCALAQLRHPDDGGVLELVAFDVPDGAHDAGPVRTGHGHVALRVASVEDALAAVQALGARPLGATVTFATGRAVYVREPAGSVIELYEPTKGT